MTLRLPWVSRAVADSIERRRVAEEERHSREIETLRSRHVREMALLEERCERERRELRSDVTRERVRSAKLTAFILRLKRDGATLLPEVALSGQRAPHREMTPIEKAIDDNPRARANPALRRHLTDWAAKERGKGTSEDTILERLAGWGAVTVDNVDEDEEPAFT